MIEADSAPASETIAAHSGLKEWHCVWDQMPSPEKMALRTDSKAVVSLSERGYSTSSLAYAKAIGCKQNLMKDLIEMDEIEVMKITGLKNRADGMTKVLGRVKHEEFTRAMCVMPPEKMRECAYDKEAWLQQVEHEWIEGGCERK